MTDLRTIIYSIIDEYDNEYCNNLDEYYKAKANALFDLLQIIDEINNGKSLEEVVADFQWN